MSDLRPLEWEEHEVETQADLPPAGPLTKAAAVLATILILFVAGLLLRTALAAYQWAPYSDAHDWIGRVFDLERSKDWLGYLWAPHTAQRIPIVRLATAVDIEYAKGHWPTFLIFGAVLWFGGLISAIVLIARTALPAIVRIAVSLIVAILALNMSLAEELALPVFSVYLFVAGPALAALSLIALAKAEFLSWTFWLALILAALASFGNAAGLAIWPCLILVLYLANVDRRAIAVALTGGVFCCVFVEAGLSTPSTSLGAGGEGVMHLQKIVTYFLIFGGMPWSRAGHGFGVQASIGAAIWLAAILSARLARKDRRLPIAATGLGLILFGLLVAAMASIGRVDELPEPIVPTRYAPFATLLQIGILMAGSGPLARFARNRPRSLGVGVFAVVVAMLAAVAPGARRIGQTAAHIRAASELFDRTGKLSDVPIHPRPAVATEVRNELKRRGLPY